MNRDLSVTTETSAYVSGPKNPPEQQLFEQAAATVFIWAPVMGLRCALDSHCDCSLDSIESNLFVRFVRACSRLEGPFCVAESRGLLVPFWR